MIKYTKTSKLIFQKVSLRKFAFYGDLYSIIYICWGSHSLTSSLGFVKKWHSIWGRPPQPLSQVGMRRLCLRILALPLVVQTFWHSLGGFPGRHWKWCPTRLCLRILTFPFVLQASWHSLGGCPRPRWKWVPTRLCLRILVFPFVLQEIWKHSSPPTINKWALRRLRL